jgi:hypothetical protein
MSSGWSQYKQGTDYGGSKHTNIFFPLSGAIAAVASTALAKGRSCLDRSRVSRLPSASEEFEILEMLILRALTK